jgi:restriction system protein
MWKITAGRGNAFVTQFIDENMVAIGWSEAGDYLSLQTREELSRRFSSVWPDQTARQIQVGAGQVFRFLHELSIGDDVLTYDPGSRLYHLGKIVGEASYEPQLLDRLPVRRPVEWLNSVGRDSLTDSTKNSLGAILTIFKLPQSAAEEILARIAGNAPAECEDTPAIEARDPYFDIEDQAIERVKDKILSLTWDELQELVAALLRALGYRTMVSPAGPDRGRDILASRDGFGFEPPRIVVEVKHRRGAMGAPEVRAFLGGRHSDDRGLYVSTGGFTREAQYEADRASTVTHLMNLDDLARALIEQYDQLDQSGQSLLRLQRIYWPL